MLTVQMTLWHTVVKRDSSLYSTMPKKFLWQTCVAVNKNSEFGMTTINPCKKNPGRTLPEPYIDKPKLDGEEAYLLMLNSGNSRSMGMSLHGNCRSRRTSVKELPKPTFVVSLLSGSWRILLQKKKKKNETKARCNADWM